MSGIGALWAFAGEPKKGEFFVKLVERVGWSEIVQIAGTILIAVVAAWAFQRIVLRRFERLAKRTDNDVDDRLVYFMSRFYKGLIAFAALLVVLRVLRVELTPLLAGAGIVGIAVAYAAKDILGNLLSGIFLLIDRPIKHGDRIRIERIGRDWGSWGDVVDVGLRTTTVKNTDGVHVTYPNAKLAESIIQNFSPTRDPVRFRVRVLVAYEADLEQALSLMEEVARRDPVILDEPAPGAVVRSLVSQSEGRLYDGALLELRCYVKDIRVRTRQRSKLLIAIKKAFGERGIRLAQPTSPSTTKAD